MDLSHLGWINSILLGIIVFFLQDMWRRIKKIEERGNQCILKAEWEKLCAETHGEVDKFLHKHAEAGQAGEVVTVK